MYKWFKWRISGLHSVSARVNARGYPCAKGCNSSASQWLSGEQVRLCSGHPKVHFGTIVEGSWGRVLGGSGLCHYMAMGDGNGHSNWYQNVELNHVYQAWKEEEEMPKWSIFTIFTGFLCSHLLNIINHYEPLCYFKLLHNRIIAQVLTFP